MASADALDRGEIGAARGTLRGKAEILELGSVEATAALSDGARGNSVWHPRVSCSAAAMRSAPSVPAPATMRSVLLPMSCAYDAAALDGAALGEFVPICNGLAPSAAANA